MLVSRNVTTLLICFCIISGCGTPPSATVEGTRVTSADREHIATDTVLHAFQGDTDGAYPTSTLIELNGVLFGTTRGGLACGYDGCGSVFEISPSGTGYKVIHTFYGNPDAATPIGGFVSLDGMLYGAAMFGGENGVGAVYQVDPTNGATKVIYSLPSSFNGYPGGPLTAANGLLFGTAEGGGEPDCQRTSGCGVLFQMAPTVGKAKTIHKFTGANGDGAAPAGNLVQSGDDIYGTTVYGGGNECDSGCGTVYRIGVSGAGYKVLHAFRGPGRDGLQPQGLVAIDGTLYGTVWDLGKGGAVFALDSNGAHFRIVRILTDDKGSLPVGALLAINGEIVGGASYGGANGDGAIFRMKTNGSGYQNVYSFKGGNNDGSQPGAGLFAIGNVLYGTTLLGGGSGCHRFTGCGTVFGIPFAAQK